MLKRLELVGFKSFADRTVFAFPPGITAIVGPNGSGKSNVVDAIRWLLGEQSAKALRGGEMADVIFNGSAGRKSLGMAEVSMTLDNSSGVLNHPAGEVQVVRRVYRDGQGEYLINGQACRLKDVKDLFLGSGAGTQALSIIEQGRVAALVEAPGHDHRGVFEEAAGISRYKVKKIEALRRLEKVEANLARARDILTAAEERLRTVRLQAAKAQAHQQHAARVKELRIALGQADYAAHAATLAGLADELQSLRDDAAKADEASREWHARLTAHESALAAVEERLQAGERERQALQAAIAAHDADAARESARTESLTTQHADAARRIDALDARTAAHAAGDPTAERDRAVTEQQGRTAEATRAQAAARQADVALEALRAEMERDRADHFTRMRDAAALRNEATGRSAHLKQLRADRDRLTRRTAAVAENLASLDVELDALTASETAVTGRLAEHRQARDQHADRRRDLLAGLEADRARQAERRVERSGLASRIEVLEGLERSHEGLGTGIRELLTLLDRGGRDAPPAGVVLGLIADCLTVPRDAAPLIDLALGPVAKQFLTVDADVLADYLAGRGSPFAGRVSFVPVRTATAVDAAAPPGAGIARRADGLVTCDQPALVGLPRQLLGTTLVVPELAVARDLAARTPGYRFVTLAGELLEADGTLTVGTHHAEAGILSRKSELRELRGRMARLDADLLAADASIAERADSLARLEAHLRHLEQEASVLAEQAADLRSRVGQHRERRDGLHAEATTHAEELAAVEGQLTGAEAAETRAVAAADAAEVSAHDLQSRVGRAEETIRQQEAAREAAHAAAATARVVAAQAEARRAHAEERWAAWRTEADALAAEADQLHTHAVELEARRVEAADRARDAGLAAAAERERLLAADAARAADVEARTVAKRERDALRGSMQAAQSDGQARQGRLHALELQAHDAGHRRDAAAGKLMEEYGFDLPAHHAATGGELPDGFDAAAASGEIEELKRKLTRLGHVNLAALDELDEAEGKAGELRVKHDDLGAAQKALADIIARINTDSERLFVETFALIRTNFQELFRKLFGGGVADVVLENEADPLESGIQIIARPPGKELRRIGLMSGGEKSLTAVALLLAIFRSKPSPFCVLDEVDAALDETNTSQLATALREFTDRSQFIVVTHHKRSMAAADVLYGVTMQEGGVSKRVAVRFDDYDAKAA